MKSTTEIKKQLTSIQAEIDRINDLEFDDPEIGPKQFFYRNGKVSEIEGHTFDKEITILVAKRSVLKWVLDIKY
jgi:hypothetical protein